MRSARGRTATRSAHALEALVDQGRYTEALAEARAARRRAGGPGAALAEAGALVGLMRPAEALVVISGALRRTPRDPDLAARLRALRARLLWEQGRVLPASQELEATEWHSVHSCDSRSAWWLGSVAA